MTEILLAIVCLVVGMIALGTVGAMRRRQTYSGWRMGIAGAGILSATAAVMLTALVGGLGAVVFVFSALTVLIGAAVLIGLFVAFVSSIDEMLTPRPPPQRPDFRFLTEERPVTEASPRKRSSRLKRLDKVRERIAKMEFLNGWSFMRRPPQ